MELRYRRIEPEGDRDYVLERHCRVNYACDCDWAAARGYAAYRAAWFGMPGQIDKFWGMLTDSMRDARTLAVIAADGAGAAVGYLWAPFTVWESGDACAEVQGLYVEEAFRRRGVAGRMLAYTEDNARANGARVLRSGTGSRNGASIRMHEKAGFGIYRVEFEKVL